MTDRYMHLNPTHFVGIVSALDMAEQATDPQGDPQAKNTLETSGAKMLSSVPSEVSEATGR
jgi:hypothetical protein